MNEGRLIVYSRQDSAPGVPNGLEKGFGAVYSGQGSATGVPNEWA